MKKNRISGSTFGAVLGPLFLLPFGRPLGRFGVGGPTGSCKERESERGWDREGSHSVFHQDPHPHRRMACERPVPTCCCLRGRPLPLRWGSGGDWAVLVWGDGSLVPLLLMPVSVHLRWRAWASKPGRGGLRAGKGRHKIRWLILKATTFVAKIRLCVTCWCTRLFGTELIGTLIQLWQTWGKHESGIQGLKVEGTFTSQCATEI